MDVANSNETVSAGFVQVSIKPMFFNKRLEMKKTGLSYPRLCQCLLEPSLSYLALLPIRSPLLLSK